MRVGIISMQRVVNCGSFLQAYGLKKLIESLGYQVEFVDYHIEKPLCKNAEDETIYKKNRMKNLILNVISSVPLLFRLLPKEIRYSVEDRYRYKSDYFHRLGLTDKKNYRSAVDTLVIGSDEVFNCLQLNPEVGFSPELFGKNSPAANIITYAASFGNTTWEEIISSGKTGELRNYFHHMNAMSARDQNSAYIIEQLTGYEPKHHLDPVLMYGFTEEIPDLDIKEDYILVYAYRRRIHQEEAKVIIEFAKKRNLKIISVGGYQPFCDENILLSPFEVLGYFRKAQYVFTDTFHGTIFSVINHRPFVSFVREGHGKNYGNSEKMDGLLSDLGLLDRKITNVDELESVATATINYDIVDTIICDERKKTLEYLKNNI